LYLSGNTQLSLISSPGARTMAKIIRGSSEGMDGSLGLGPHLVGKQIDIHGRSLEICEQLGEGGFSFVYLVRSSKVSGHTNANDVDAIGGGGRGGVSESNMPQHLIESHQYSERQRQNPSPSPPPFGTQMVLKITSVHNNAQRQMAEKEAKLLRTLSHPSIVQVYDHGFRKIIDESSSNIESPSDANGRSLSSKLAQHLILMEYCEGGTAFDAIKRMKSSSSAGTPVSNGNFPHRYDVLSLVISFGQICNAVSYLHAQRPPIIHRDLKPVNFLIKNGAYKLCDFGSAVIGHTDLQTPERRRKAEEVLNKTTTQMFRAPEMVDLYMAKRLTQSTDVWALGCCLYSLAFLRDCFEEGSNLAILSRKFQIPDDNPYGDGLVELIDRMLAVDYRERADMSEVIMCLSALYSNRPLPKRKWGGKSRGERKGELKKMGAYRTDGQGIRLRAPIKKKKVVEAKKLDPNSAAAKRKKASEVSKKKTNLPSAHVSGNGVSNSAPPSLFDGSYQNFASFDRVFEENLDHFDSLAASSFTPDSGTSKADNVAFSSMFDEQCKISVASSSQLGGDGRNGCGDDEFEVTFQGFASDN